MSDDPYPITPTDLRAVVDATGLSQQAVARAIGIAPQTLRRYLASDAAATRRPIPRQTWMAIAYLRDKIHTHRRGAPNGPRGGGMLYRVMGAVLAAGILITFWWGGAQAGAVEPQTYTVTQGRTMLPPHDGYYRIEVDATYNGRDKGFTAVVHFQKLRWNDAKYANEPHIHRMFGWRYPDDYWLQKQSLRLVRFNGELREIDRPRGWRWLLGSWRSDAGMQVRMKKVWWETEGIGIYADIEAGKGSATITVSGPWPEIVKNERP